MATVTMRVEMCYREARAMNTGNVPEYNKARKLHKDAAAIAARHRPTAA